MNDQQWLDAEGLKRWQPLFQAALKARANAYAPYSHFQVGAAVMTRHGALHGGANYESASYGLSFCAERSALVAAQAAGAVPDLIAIALCAKPGDGEPDQSQIVTPCGACRQWIFEASQRAGNDITVLCGNADFSRVLVMSAHSLLPEGFSF